MSSMNWSYNLYTYGKVISVSRLKICFKFSFNWVGFIFVSKDNAWILFSCEAHMLNVETHLLLTLTQLCWKEL